MAIVYIKNKRSGTTYAFESTSHWDPSLKQSRPIRKYLGRVDPVTNLIIPSSGRRGRRKKEEDPISDPHMANGDYKVLYYECCETVRHLEEELKVIKAQNARLKKLLDKALKHIEEAQETLSELNDE